MKIMKAVRIKGRMMTGLLVLGAVLGMGVRFLAAETDWMAGLKEITSDASEKQEVGLFEQDTTLMRREYRVESLSEKDLFEKTNQKITQLCEDPSPQKNTSIFNHLNVSRRVVGPHDDIPTLRGCGFSRVPADKHFLVYDMINVKKAGKYSVVLATEGALAVSLNGKEIFSQKNAERFSKNAPLILDLKAGDHYLLMDVGPTEEFAILTVRKGRRLGDFLVPLYVTNPVAFAWFEKWLESPYKEYQGDPLRAMLQQVGEEALEGLQKTKDNEKLRQELGDALKGNRPLDLIAKTVLKVCESRREQRLAALASQAPAVAYSVHKEYANITFIGYTEGLSDARHERHFVPGTSLNLLDLSGKKSEVKVLMEDPYGMIRDPDISYDGKSILFAWKKSDRNDDFQLYEMDLKSQESRQLTYGLGMANLEGAYLPDNTIVFCSTRGEHSVPCHTTEVSNLYKMERDGTFLRRLAVDQVHTLYPKPTDDGRITYTRWDYSDRGQVYPHGLYQMNLDGTMQAALYGTSSWFPTSKLHARQIPGTRKFLAVASGHHTTQMGKVIEIDPTVGRDEGKGLRFLAVARKYEYEKKDRASQEGPLFSHPYPLAGETFLAAHAPATRFTVQMDLYWFTYDGQRELLAYDTKGRSCLYPVLVRPRDKGHLRPNLVDYNAKDSLIIIEDIYKGAGMNGVKWGEADRLRVVELRYRSASVGFMPNSGLGGNSTNGTPIAVGQGSWDVKAIIGEVPIGADGSVAVRVPSMKSLYYQILDKRGQVIQTMRTWDTLQPGEVKSCGGCHSYSANEAPTTPPQGTPSWSKKIPATLTPFAPTGWNGFSFTKHLQPILNNSCVSCHNGTDPNRMDLRGDVTEADVVAKRNWPRSYIQLTNATRKDEKSPYSGNPNGPWVKWINKMSEPTPLPPNSTGSVVSPLMKMLRDGHHGVNLSDLEYRTLAAWIDLLVPLSGDYHEGALWTEQDKDFYCYYEDKRRVNKIEEAAEIGAFLKGKEDEKPKIDEVKVVIEGENSFSEKLTSKQFKAGVATLELPGLKPGDKLTISGAPRLILTLGSLSPAEIVLPGNTFTWETNPALAAVLPPDILRGQKVSLKIQIPTDKERSAYRNLACNPLALPVKSNETPRVFPSASASSECRQDIAFLARNAIDGVEKNGKHGYFPYQSWGPDSGSLPDLQYSIAFGRMVRIDRVDLIQRADYPHDKPWTSCEVWALGRKIREVRMDNSSGPQTALFEAVECEEIQLRNFRSNEPGWYALTEFRVWGVDADRTFKSRIKEGQADGTLQKVPLQ